MFLLGLLAFVHSQILPASNSTPTCDFPPLLHHYMFTVTSEVILTTGMNVTKPNIVVNGLLPGPVIEANESDWILIDLYNKLENNVPVSIHWHGLFQTSTSFNDGVPNVSQCLKSTNSSFRYLFKAEPAGTTWWHGHFDNQYVDGLFGPLIIHRRGGDLYQHAYQSEWIWNVNDWYDYPARLLRTEWYLTPKNTQGIEPEPDAIMVNGKFTSYLRYDQVDPTKRVLVRVINSAAFSMYNVSVDHLVLNVVAIDGMDLEEPLVLPWIMINVAQRMDFILDFSTYPFAGLSSIEFHFDAYLPMYPVDILTYIQPSPPYPPNTTCRFNPHFVGTITFSTPTGIPLQPPSNLTLRICNDTDFNYLDARPFDRVPLLPPTHSINLTISFNTYTNVQLAYLNNLSFSMNSMGVQYGMPELYAFVLQSANGTATEVALNASGPGPVIHSDNLLRFYIPDNAIVDVFIINTDSGDHPFHLHGHNFQVLATSDCPQAKAAFSPNYLRRDTVSVPLMRNQSDPNTVGWVWLRLTASNPGAWMFHCHIDWHLEAGLACLFMEGPIGVNLNHPPPDQILFCHPDASMDENTLIIPILTSLEMGFIIVSACLFVLLLGTCVTVWYK
jgi:iron transport multicopper oxidase